ncbi:hypothetical protein FOPG_17831 [Fusarium oxysporum f. sp. conglutinans race 2 54008]|uniref:Uncharacterized protein n=1 Tax=Fusarium oxysporum f. sp. conglutinans race 2 54008 TaxID=1089457 RepID=X0GQT9_FUSOX|nr:hypothetical protein FOPG_17831 [Fusarium oxysporum f. sp. conglutinans race 2 54008]KAI8411475.1 hypothetical protein FOFC_08069 [Fusarium oxysporum]
MTTSPQRPSATLVDSVSNRSSRLFPQRSMQLKYHKENKFEDGESNSVDTIIFLSIYLGVYMSEALILTEYSCRYEHGNRSMFIVALKNALVSRSPYLSSPLAVSLYWHVSERSACDGPIGFIALEGVSAASWRTAALLMCQKNVF